MRLFKILILPLIAFGLLAPLSAPTPVRAESDRGYLWSLTFDFEKNFEGRLKIEVGPWKNGDLVSVDETSTTTIRCNPVGAVWLDGGDAVFDGGYLECNMDLGRIVAANHRLIINPVDTYGSILLRTRLQTNSQILAPIFTHPHAAYRIDFSQTSSVTPVQDLWNSAGAQQALFPGVVGSTMQTYTYIYSCISNGGPCDAGFLVGAAWNSQPTAGSRVQFATTPSTFLIGSDGAATFTGRMQSLLIDPGNSVH